MFKIEFFSLKVKSIIFIVNLLLLLIISFSQYLHQLSKLEDNFNFNVENVIKKELSNHISTVKGVITSLSSYYKSSNELNSSSFSTLSKDLFKNYSYIETVAFATIVNKDNKNSFIEDMRFSEINDFDIKRYNKDNQIVKNEKKENKYGPIIYIEPSSYKYSRFYGFDIYNDNSFKKYFNQASRSDNVIIKDRFIDELGNTMHLFIKATYSGEISVDSDDYRFKNTNGFYIININLEKVIEKVKDKFKEYEIRVIETHNLEKNIDVSFFDNIFSKELTYFEEIDNFNKSYLYVSKKINYSDFNIMAFLLVLLFVIISQILYILVLYKDRHSKYKLSYRASHDDLTGLTNRNYFKREFYKKIKRISFSSDNVIAILFMDLDRFKEINDSFGHKFGDEVLIEVSKRLKRTIRANDLICRQGGDEFLILIDDISKMDDLEKVVNKIMTSIAEPIVYKNQKIHLTISIGISLYPNNGKTIDDLLKNADSAMYKAKEDGRNGFKFYTEDMSFEVMKRVILENKIREAILNEDFIVYYQPQYNGLTNKLMGMEALVRWKNPQSNELIPPDEFIPIAQDAGFIVEIDRIVMKKAIKDFAFLLKQGFDIKTLSLNLAMKQLKSDDFISLLFETIEAYNCNPNSIELEVTEGAIMEDPLSSIEKLQRISNYGVKLSVDDFGTGYSSLAYLKKLPINKLKIDRAFIKDLPFDEEDVAISKSVIALAKSLKLEVIAEGVETKEQKDFLVKNDCLNIQGYYYSKPIPFKELEELLNSLK